MLPSDQVHVLDTNVLLYDPNALEVFTGATVVIPITVIEEIDRFKKDLNETGRNARLVSRRLDALRQQGRLSEGVPLPHGGCVRVDLPDPTVVLPPGFGPTSNDNLILSTVLGLAVRLGEGRVRLVTRDTNMRLKADALRIQADDYEHAHVHFDESYTGVSDIEVPAAQVAELYEKGGLPLSEAEGRAQGFYPNQFFVLRADDGSGRSALARWDARTQRLRVVGRGKESVWGIVARNKEQTFALDLLLDESVSLVTLDGVAGTGKTLLAIAAGLKMVAEDTRYRRLVVSRPIFPLGRDVGFLPGDIKEKLNPWMKPIFDNLDLLVSTQSDDGRGRAPPRGEAGYQYLIDRGLIEIEALTYIRGRSLPGQYLIVDEAQNLTPHEVKTVITRAGEGTKVILTGDPMQIDNPYVDATSNGLTYVVERFKGSALAGHVTLRKGERSPLAELAARTL